MKVTVCIEEIISQMFEVEVPDGVRPYDEVRKQYIEGKLVLENPALTQANVMILDKNGEETDWDDLHV